MRKLSITFVLIIAAIYTASAAILEKKQIEFKDDYIWDEGVRTPTYIPIYACIENNNCIYVNFLNEESQSAFLKIKDWHGTIIFQEMVTSNTGISYKIDLNSFKPGKYQLIYSDEKIEIVGSFLID